MPTNCGIKFVVLHGGRRVEIIRLQVTPEDLHEIASRVQRVWDAGTARKGETADRWPITAELTLEFYPDVETAWLPSLSVAGVFL